MDNHCQQTDSNHKDTARRDKTTIQLLAKRQTDNSISVQICIIQIFPFSELKYYLWQICWVCECGNVRTWRTFARQSTKRRDYETIHTGVYFAGRLHRVRYMQCVWRTCADFENHLSHASRAFERMFAVHRCNLSLILCVLLSSYHFDFKQRSMLVISSLDECSYIECGQCQAYEATV